MCFKSSQCPMCHVLLLSWPFTERKTKERQVEQLSKGHEVVESETEMRLNTTSQCGLSKVREACHWDSPLTERKQSFAYHPQQDVCVWNTPSRSELPGWASF